MRLFVHALAWICAGIALAGWTAEPPPAVRVTVLNVPGAGSAGFTLLSPDQTRVTFTNTLDDLASAGNRVLNNGSGVAAGDFDNDGLTDIFFCSLNQRNRLFKNLGNWQFKDVTDEAGLSFRPLYFRAATFADLDGDNWLDLLVGSVARGILCFLNDRRGHFTNATEQAGLAYPFANSTIALADIDGNGTLDLYACNNRNDDIRDLPRVPMMYVNRKPTVPPHLQDRIRLNNGVIQELADPDILFLNDGRAHFRYVSFTNGAFFDEQGEPLKSTPLDWGLTAAFRDLNNDGAPDLYVCNDYWTPDRIWINGGRGRFKAVSSSEIRKTPASSMGVDFADINRDGFLDIFAVDMLSRSSELRRRQVVAKSPTAPRIGDAGARVQTPQNTLLLNRGDGTFAEIACLARLEASDWSWSPAFLDVDLDGYDDLLITAGHIRDVQDLDATDKIRPQQEAWRQSPMAATNLQRAFIEAKREHQKYYPPLSMPVVAFRNRGDLHFDEMTAGWGLNVLSANHGMATADFDNDGDLDLVVNRLGAPAAIFRNNSIAPRIAVRLRGKAPNTQAIGAKIELLGAAISNQVQEITCGGSYMSGSDTLRVFAPGSVPSGLGLRITWRDQSITELSDVKPNHVYDVDELTAARFANRPARISTPPSMFEDLSGLLNHTHHEAAFDDFVRQPLLPRKLSQGGPGLAWFDVNGDGWDDLIIGSARGGRMAVFRNAQGGSFSRDTNVLSVGAVTRDQTAVLGWRHSPEQRTLLAASASYEDGDTNAPMAHAYNLATGKPQTTFAGHTASVGPLAVADIDGDGDLDLFVGGQVIPGKYPQPASSLLFRNTAETFQRDQQNVPALANAGLVNGAVWSDLDNDGFPELILACEWSPVAIFRNDRGSLSRWNPSLRAAALGSQPATLNDLSGFWQSVTAGDFDGDGLLDIVAGNWGLNSCWRASADRPLTIFYGDLAGLGATDILETEFDPSGRLVPRHLRDILAPSIPWLTAAFPTHVAWSRTTIADVLRNRQSAMKKLTISTLATTVFLNRKDHFEARPLPAEAQFAPVFGMCVSDFDGDGQEDIFLAQNFFAFRVEDARLDAGRGLLLRGDGKGGFAAVPGSESGVQIHGEQRGAAVADFDHDGRVDLAVGQNGRATMLFRNITGQPGVRVRLNGSSSNPDAIGAVVRLKFGESWGPAREIHCGSGYWSQDSSCVVLAVTKTPTAIQVSWPGGQRTEQTLSQPGSEIVVKVP